MNILRNRILLFFLCFLLNNTFSQTAQPFFDLKGQDILKLCEGKYRVNDIIYNGKVYLNPYTNVIGTPYLNNSAISNCTLFKLGKSYAHKKVFLDILNKQLILETRNVFGGIEQIILPQGGIDSIHGNETRYIYDPSLGFYLEIIANIGEQQLLLSQSKKLGISKTEMRHELFLEPPTIYYHDLKGTYSIKRKKDLIRRVDETSRDALKIFMRTNHFSLKKINTSVYQNIMTKISHLK